MSGNEPTDDAPLVVALRAQIPRIVDPFAYALTPDDFMCSVALAGAALAAALVAIEGKTLFGDAEQHIRRALRELDPVRATIDQISRP